jgi:hypothetical protein
MGQGERRKGEESTPYPRQRGTRKDQFHTLSSENLPTSRQRETKWGKEKGERRRIHPRHCVTPPPGDCVAINGVQRSLTTEY